MSENCEKSVGERLKQRIRQHGETYKIDELCLDQIPFQTLTPDLCKTIEKCINVEYLTLQTCALSDISVVPRLPKLQTLELDHNSLSDEMLKNVSAFKTLKELTIKNNKITSLQTFKSLEDCKYLERIQLAGNSAATENYRHQLFSLLPQLQIIDGMNRLGNEVVINDDEDEDSQASEEENVDEESEEGERESPSKIRKLN